MERPRSIPGGGPTIAAFLAGVALLGLGLIFLCAAVQNPARWPIALALFIPGALLAGWAGLRWRRARQLDPDVLDDNITALAGRSDAEVTLASIVSDLGVPDDAARAALARLEAAGIARPQRRGDRTVYLFPGLQESKVIRRCTYCGNEYSVREPLHKCPNCGGTLEVVRT
ncbi:MAG TPA: hypothetical protein VLC95_10005 [Anaerolineae bacterium]|nr:hypothetical protein [Anaerolineae bacterium]